MELGFGSQRLLVSKRLRLGAVNLKVGGWDQVDKVFDLFAKKAAFADLQPDVGFGKRGKYFVSMVDVGIDRVREYSDVA